MIMDHLPCHGGAQIDVRRVRGQQQRFQPRMQAPVHHGLLILRVEIALGPDAPDNGGSLPLRGEIGQQAAVQLRRYVGQL